MCIGYAGEKLNVMNENNVNMCVVAIMNSNTINFCCACLCYAANKIKHHLLNREYPFINPNKK